MLEYSSPSSLPSQESRRCSSGGQSSPLAGAVYSCTPSHQDPCQASAKLVYNQVDYSLFLSFASDLKLLQEVFMLPDVWLSFLILPGFFSSLCVTAQFEHAGSGGSLSQGRKWKPVSSSIFGRRVICASFA
jgi:hypothetical protein